MYQQTVKWLIYTGRARYYPIWTAIFVAMIHTKGLYKSQLGSEEQPNEPLPLANGAKTCEKKNPKVLMDAYEKEVALIREKRNNVWCHLALTLDATTLLLIRHDSEGDENLGDWSKAWRLLPERFQNVEMLRVVTLAARLARPQLEDSENVDSFFIKGETAGSSGSSLRDFLQRLGRQWFPNEIWNFCYTGKLLPWKKHHRVE